MGRFIELLSEVWRKVNVLILWQLILSLGQLPDSILEDLACRKLITYNNEIRD